MGEPHVSTKRDPRPKWKSTRHGAENDPRRVKNTRRFSHACHAARRNLLVSFRYNPSRSSRKFRAAPEIAFLVVNSSRNFGFISVCRVYFFPNGVLSSLMAVQWTKKVGRIDTDQTLVGFMKRDRDAFTLCHVWPFVYRWSGRMCFKRWWAAGFFFQFLSLGKVFMHACVARKASEFVFFLWMGI